MVLPSQEFIIKGRPGKARAVEFSLFLICRAGSPQKAKAGECDHLKSYDIENLIVGIWSLLSNDLGKVDSTEFLLLCGNGAFPT